MEGLKLIPLPQRQSVVWQKRYLEGLQHPMDGMWLHHAQKGQFWKIRFYGEDIGFFCLKQAVEIVQFFVLPQRLPIASSIFRYICQVFRLKRAIVSTADALLLSVGLECTTTKVAVEGYLFADGGGHIPTFRQESIQFIQATFHELDEAIAFFTENLGSEFLWTQQYLQQRIAQQELFLCYHDRLLVGTGELRRNSLQPPYADVGVAVKKTLRGRQYASSIVAWLRSAAQVRELLPIASCATANIASFKALTRAGMLPVHRLLKISLSSF